MTLPHAHPEEIRDRIRDLHAKGLSMRDIAVAMGWGKEGKNKVCGIVNRMIRGGTLKGRGTPLTGNSATRFRLAPTKTTEILQKLRAGLSVNAVSRDLSVSKDVITRIRTVNHIPVHKPGPPPGTQPASPPPGRRPVMAIIDTPAQPSLLLPARPVQPPLKMHQCQWLEGDRKPWVQCTNKALDRVWCSEHRRRVYTRRCEEAA